MGRSEMVAGGVSSAYVATVFFTNLSILKYDVVICRESGSQQSASHDLALET
jgi:hypothetical protein